MHDHLSVCCPAALILLMTACSPADVATSGTYKEQQAPPAASDGVEEHPSCIPHIPPITHDVARPLETFRTAAFPNASMGCAILEDLDNDGALDFIWANEQDNQLGPALRFAWSSDIDAATSQYLPPHLGDIVGCTVNDDDDDGDLDLLLLTNTGVFITSQVGAREFGIPRTLLRFSDLPAMPQGRPLWLTLLDIDHTGPLDLLIAYDGSTPDECEIQSGATGAISVYMEFETSSSVHCYTRATDGALQPATGRACPSPVIEGSSHIPFDTIIADLNDDGLDDVIILNDFGRNQLLFGSETDGLVRSTEFRGFEVYDHAMGGALADFDGDGFPDLYISDMGTDSIYASQGCATWFDMLHAWDLPRISEGSLTWGVQAGDFDHNGAIDILVANSADFGDMFEHPVPVEQGCSPDLSSLPKAPHLLLLNGGGGALTRYDVEDGLPHTSAFFRSIKLLAGDIDGDGDLDGIVIQRYGISVLHNEIPKVGHWLQVRPRTPQGAPSVGARVVIEHEDGSRRMAEVRHRTGTGGHTPLQTHFGLGPDPAPVRIHVRWPDQSWTTHGPVAVDQVVEVHQPLTTDAVSAAPSWLNMTGRQTNDPP